MVTDTTRKYKIVSFSGLTELDYSLLEDTSIETTRTNLSETLAIIEYIDEIIDGLTNQEIIDYIDLNWFEWNEF